jgi:hypothetical protein
MTDDPKSKNKEKGNHHGWTIPITFRQTILDALMSTENPVTDPGN